MYKVSYEKCVCFIFLVILAILSCSGFRIDNLAMTDVSKRNNFHTSNSFSNSDNFFDRIFNVRSSPSAETVTPVYRHKLRHHRQLRAQAHNSHRRYDTQKPPSGHIDVQVFPPRGPGFPPTTHPSEHFAQIPSTDIHHPLFPTKPIVMTRSQRSSDHKRHQKQEQPRWQPSQEEDFSMKAFKAEIVVLAQVESSSPFQYVFKVNTTYKSKFPVNNRIALRIPSEKEKSQKSKNLVINKIQLGKSYVLFLNASSAHNYWSVSDPKVVGRPIKRARIDKVLKQVCNTKFVPTKPKIVELREVSRKKTEKRKLLCKVKGFPIPTISWRRKGQVLYPNPSVRIQYRRKQSRLIIKSMDANSYGQYECIAEGVNGEVASKAIPVSEPSQTLSESFSSGKECDAPLRTSYCHNGGTCHKEVSMGENYCICAPGYSGMQCDKKEPSLSSMYHQPAIYTCKLGLSTKYYC